MTLTDLPDGPIRVLVSSCLLGEKVRYDGGHKRDPFLVETLGMMGHFRQFLTSDEKQELLEVIGRITPLSLGIGIMHVLEPRLFVDEQRFGPGSIIRRMPSQVHFFSPLRASCAFW